MEIQEGRARRRADTMDATSLVPSRWMGTGIAGTAV